MKVFIVGLAKGCFRLVTEKQQIGTCPLDVQSLAGLFRTGGFDPSDGKCILMHSSSINHPEDYDTPRGFKPHSIIEQALVAIGQKQA